MTSNMLGQFLTLLKKDQSLSLLTMELQVDPGDYLYQHGVNTASLRRLEAEPGSGGGFALDPSAEQAST